MKRRGFLGLLCALPFAAKARPELTPILDGGEQWKNITLPNQELPRPIKITANEPIMVHTANGRKNPLFKGDSIHFDGVNIIYDRATSRHPNR